MISRLARFVTQLLLRYKNTNIFVLAWGSAGANLVVIVITPVLARLYTPESFGIFASFTAITAFLNAFSSLRLEVAIPIVPRDRDANSLALTCVALVSCFVVIIAILIPFSRDSLVYWHDLKRIDKFLWLIPAAVFSLGIFQVLSYCAIRASAFKTLAHVKLYQSLSSSLLTIFLAGLGPLGLILGQTLMQCLAIAQFIRARVFRLENIFLFELSFLKRFSVKFSGFIFYNTPSGLVNVAASSIPVILLFSYFDQDQIGQFFLAQKLLLFPASLVGTSVSQVYLSGARKAFSAGNLRNVIFSFAQKLFVVGGVFCLVAYLLLPLIIPMLLGAKWALASRIVVLLLPLLLGNLVVSTLSTTYYVTHALRLELIAQCLFAVFSIFPMWIFCALHNGFQNTILVYSIGSAFGYIVYGMLMLSSLSNSGSSIVR